jgi:hypothetical protein
MRRRGIGPNISKQFVACLLQDAVHTCAERLEPPALGFFTLAVNAAPKGRSIPCRPMRSASGMLCSRQFDGVEPKGRRYASQRLLQSIIGAMLKRRSNILTLFRFFVSAAIADFCADGSSKRTTEAFSFCFKRLQEELVRTHQAHPLRGTALQLQYRMNSCSTAMRRKLLPSSIPDSNRSIPAKFRHK